MKKQLTIQQVAKKVNGLFKKDGQHKYLKARVVKDTLVVDNLSCYYLLNSLDQLVYLATAGLVKSEFISTSQCKPIL